MKTPGPGPGPWHSSPCLCPGPWRKVLVKVLADQFFKQNFATDDSRVAAVPTPSFSVVENILHPGFISTSRTRVFSEWPYSAATSCENETFGNASYFEVQFCLISFIFALRVRIRVTVCIVYSYVLLK